MATTYHSPPDVRLILPVPTTPPPAPPSDEAIRVDPTAVEPISREKRRVKVDVSSWKLVERRDSREALEAKRKAVAARIDMAAGMLKKSTSTRVCRRGDARILSGALSDIQLALLESKAAIQVAPKLPHVESTGANPRVPRSLALAASYLQSAQSAFNENSFADSVIQIQETVPLEMFEVWNLKAFLELVILEQISNALSNISLDEQLDSDSSSDSPETVSPFSALLDSLQRISELNWKLFFETISKTEQILRSDPQGAYERMDFETREAYRAVVTDLAERSGWSEPEVVRKAIDLARAALNVGSGNPGSSERKTHVGYYLVDKGHAELKKLIS